MAGQPLAPPHRPPQALVRPLAGLSLTSPESASATTRLAASGRSATRWRCSCAACLGPRREGSFQGQKALQQKFYKKKPFDAKLDQLFGDEKQRSYPRLSWAEGRINWGRYKHCTLQRKVAMGHLLQTFHGSFEDLYRLIKPLLLASVQGRCPPILLQADRLSHMLNGSETCARGAIGAETLFIRTKEQGWLGNRRQLHSKLRGEPLISERNLLWRQPQMHLQPVLGRVRLRPTRSRHRYLSVLSLSLFLTLSVLSPFISPPLAG